MHLYSIVETVLYMFYEAILNKSVYSLCILSNVFLNGHMWYKYSYVNEEIKCAQA